MLHPLQEDVTLLKDDELEEKVRDLSKKYLLASRYSNQSVLGQMQMLLTTYKEEQTRRLRKQYQETISQAKEEVETDLNELVNVDKQ
jgi:DNA polymerase III delta prime subunit